MQETSSGGTLAQVSSISVHPNFEANAPFDNDVAVWKLATQVPESSTIKFAKLAAPDSDPPADTAATVAGWFVLPHLMVHHSD